MLNSLYRKLYILFTSSVMLIITLVLSFVIFNTVHTEKSNEISLFQRLATLLIYQIESEPSNIDTVAKSYEESYNIFSFVKDSKGNIIYKSNFPFQTNTNTLLKKIDSQTSTQKLPQTNSDTTLQGGYLEIDGDYNDSYFVIPSTIVASNNNKFSAIFIYKIKNLKDILKNILPIYIITWIFSYIFISILTRYLLKKAFAPTEQMLQVQNEFVATASHELKSPLAVIISNTDLLLENNSIDNQARNLVQTIDFECMRLSRLVKDLLLLAASDAKTWTLHKNTINIDTLLITLYETYEPICMKNNINLKLDLSDESYPDIVTDDDRLLQILCIFLDNAIQHSNNNNLIEIIATYNSRSVDFSIIDHGQGITDKEKAYIFNRFYSGDKSHNNKSNFGLGLSIAKELAHMLNGDISVSDTLGGGATFTVKLPLH